MKLSSLTLLTLCVLLFFFSCKDECNDECKELQLDCNCCPPIDSTAFDTSAVTINNISIFIETSGSMKGFMPNKAATTSFQTVVPDIISRLNKGFGRPSIYSIKESSQKAEIISTEDAQEYILRGTFEWGKFTSLPEMLDTINNNRVNDGVSILISDMIYSPEDHREVSQAMSRIREKIGDASAASLIALHSDYTSSAYKLNSPYYLLIQGEPTNIKAVKDLIYESLKTHNISFDELNFGFTYPTPFYSILPYTEISGSGVPITCYGDEKRFIVITDIESPYLLSFWVGINLEDLPSYCKEVEYLDQNLKNESSGFKISREEILDLNEFKKKLTGDEVEKLITDNSTHFLKYSVSEFDGKVGTLAISLNKDSPHWLGKFGHQNIDSIDIKRDKTYGISNVYTAFYENHNEKSNRSFFKPLQITLTKKN